jgi:hypothetical protein
VRSIAADWSLSQGRGGNWLSNLRAKLQRVGRRAAAREADPLVQVDAASFVSAFRRAG